MPLWLFLIFKVFRRLFKLNPLEMHQRKHKNHLKKRRDGGKSVVIASCSWKILILLSEYHYFYLFSEEKRASEDEETPEVIQLCSAD